MHFIWESQTYNLASFIIQTVLIVLLYAAVSYIVVRSIKRYRAVGVYFGLLTLCILAYIFDFIYLFIGVNFILLILLFCYFLINIGDLRKFIANPFYRPMSTKEKVIVDKFIDKKELYGRVEDAVEILSKSRIGAIMTFERNTSLKEICKNGIAVNAPLTTELLLTIFYPGTRLHDGAVIIKDDKIEYASVFFTPTTKAFAGKYGSRHRAAIGISEITDSVTVVVSEETGLISIAADGSIENVELPDLSKVLLNYLS